MPGDNGVIGARAKMTTVNLGPDSDFIETHSIDSMPSGHGFDEGELYFGGWNGLLLRCKNGTRGDYSVDVSCFTVVVLIKT